MAQLIKSTLTIIKNTYSPNEIFRLHYKMGYNSKCRYQDCYYNCCNTQGNCPSAQSQCKYYYTTESNAGVISGASVGAVVGVVIIIAIICYCYRRRQQQAILQQVQMAVQNKNQVYRPNHLNTTNQQLSYPTFSQPNYPQPPLSPAYPPSSFAPTAFSQPSFGQPQPAYGQPAYGQPAFGQPAYGQPAYGQTLGTQPTQNAIIVTNM